MKGKRKYFSYIEVWFNLLYLLAAFLIGFFLVLNSDKEVSRLSGIMALILAGGDSFHLIPRIAAILSKNKSDLQRALGFGKLVTSVTMTIFYLLLWNLGMIIFDLNLPVSIIYAIYVLALLRIILCFFPQNKWFSVNPPVSWGIYRNIPFIIIGAATAILFAVYARGDHSLNLMWLAITLSFVFYVPVVLLAHKYPVIGMLMLPKTCAYIWMLSMFLML